MRAQIGPRARPPKRSGWPHAAAGLAFLASLTVACAPSIDAQLDEAQSLVASGQPMAALPLLERVVQRKREDGAANLLLGQVLLQVGETRTAMPPLQRALASERYAVPAGLLLGSAHLREGRPREARAAAERILATHPDQPAALRVRATANLQIGDDEAALADARHILEVSPDDSQAPVLIGTALTRLGRLDEAEAVLIALEAEAREADAAARHASACGALASFLASGRRAADRAEAIWLSCLEHHPADLGILQGATGFFDQRGEPERSTEALRLAVEHEPAALGIRLALARRLAATGDVEAGDRLLVEAAEDGVRGGFQALGSYRHQTGNTAGAVTAFGRAIEAAAEEEADALRFQRGMLLLDLGRREEAQTAQKELSSPSLAALLEGRLRFDAGEPDEALEAFERSARLRPGDPRAHYLIGTAAQALGDVDRALEAYGAALSRNPSATDAGLAAARLAHATGENERALELLRHHRLARGSSPREAILLEARSLAALGQHASAVSTLESWLERVEGDLEAISLVAQLLAHTEGPKAAVARIDRARTAGLDLLAPESLAVLHTYVTQLRAAGNGAAARELVAEARARRPDAVDLALIDASLASSLGDAPGAERILRAAVERAPEDPQALAALGRWLHGRGQDREALPLLERAAELASTDAETAYLVTKVLPGAGRGSEVEGRLRTLIDAKPLHVAACNDLAWLLAEAGRDLDLALALAERAVRLQPQAAMFDTLGWVQLRRGQPAAAIDSLEQAVARSPDDPGFRYRLGLALARAGREAEARSAFEQALAAGPFPEAPQARAELARLLPADS